MKTKFGFHALSPNPRRGARIRHRESRDPLADHITSQSERRILDAEEDCAALLHISGEGWIVPLNLRPVYARG